MNNPIKEKLKERKIRRLLRRHFDPSDEFLRSSRSDFLDAVQKEFEVARVPIHHHVIRWRYALMAVLIATMSTAGVMTYADVANVPPTHPLYQFKRVSEQIRLDFSTPQKQVQLHQDFAARRVQEIQELRQASESMETIQGLTDDFQHEAERTIDQAQKLNFQKSKRKIICQTILNSVDHAIKADKLVKIQVRCQSLGQ
ncbi:MAG TPA: DUF5667 domain-containing protein [Candidatus Paceibacterota bacterium]|nr:DUF5667 domain-containing protein [Candidatus Paceibacterota bacterium]